MGLHYKVHDDYDTRFALTRAWRLQQFGLQLFAINRAAGRAMACQCDPVFPLRQRPRPELHAALCDHEPYACWRSTEQLLTKTDMADGQLNGCGFIS
jgi:hypothetical protein